MPYRSKPYPPEYRQQILDLVRSGRSPESIEKEFQVTTTTIRSWVEQAERDAGQRADGLTSAEKEELARLRREVKALKEEREILKKAAAWFARESGSLPKWDTSS